MNTTSDVPAGRIIPQESLQTGLLILVSVTGTWFALYRIPWQLSGDPCLIAAAGTAVVVACLWLTRFGLRGVKSERNLLAGFLVAMPLVYVSGYLYAAAGRAASYWLWVEVLGALAFAALAVLGVKRSPWFLAVGMVLHGVAWDAWHYRNSTYIPDWYVIACLAVDLTIGLYVAARAPAYHRVSRIQTES